ncbi:MAG: DUF6015 family protein [Thermoplasmata archaeon]
MLTAWDYPEIITRDCLAKAIKNAFSISKISVDKDFIYSATDLVLSIFGFDLEIIENNLDQDARSVIYMLMDMGLIKAGIEETSILYSSKGKSGKYWRISYFILNQKKIFLFCKGKVKASNTKTKDVYLTLPSDVWFHNQ